MFVHPIDFEPFSDLETMALVLDPRARGTPYDLLWAKYYKQGVESLNRWSYDPSIEASPASTPPKNKNPFAPPLLLADPASAASIDTELDSYTKIDIVITPDTEILSWWSMTFKSYPRLSSMARRLLCIPASQPASESDFSLMKLICTEKRPSLSILRRQTCNSSLYLP